MEEGIYKKVIFGAYTTRILFVLVLFTSAYIFTFVTINYAKQPCGKIISVSVLRDIVNRENDRILTTYYK